MTLFTEIALFFHRDFYRIQDLPDLLTYVRLPLIHPTYFVMNIESDENVVGNPACQPLLQETRKYHILGKHTSDDVIIYMTWRQVMKSTACALNHDDQLDAHQLLLLLEVVIGLVGIICHM